MIDDVDDGEGDSPVPSEVNSCKISDLFRRFADVMDNPALHWSDWPNPGSADDPVYDAVAKRMLMNLCDELIEYAREFMGREIKRDVSTILPPEEYPDDE